MDEVGLWNGNVAPRTYVDPATRNPSVIRNGNNGRDTGLVVLSWSGSVFRYFIQHQDQRTRRIGNQTVIVQEGIGGINKTIMLSWIPVFANDVGSGPSVMIFDRLATHLNAQVQETFENYGFTLFKLPPQSGKILSPCNNKFFVTVKAQMIGMETETSEMKQKAFFEVCDNIDASLVQINLGRADAVIAANFFVLGRHLLLHPLYLADHHPLVEDAVVVLQPLPPVLIVDTLVPRRRDERQVQLRLQLAVSGVPLAEE
jgi:hypothetical protein